MSQFLKFDASALPDLLMWSEIWWKNGQIVFATNKLIITFVTQNMTATVSKSKYFICLLFQSEAKNELIHRRFGQKVMPTFWTANIQIIITNLRLLRLSGEDLLNGR